MFDPGLTLVASDDESSTYALSAEQETARRRWMIVYVVLAFASLGALSWTRWGWEAEDGQAVAGLVRMVSVAVVAAMVYFLYCARVLRRATRRIVLRADAAECFDADGVRPLPYADVADADIDVVFMPFLKPTGRFSLYDDRGKPLARMHTRINNVSAAFPEWLARIALARGMEEPSDLMGGVERRARLSRRRRGIHSGSWIIAAGLLFAGSLAVWLEVQARDEGRLAREGVETQGYVFTLERKKSSKSARHRAFYRFADAQGKSRTGSSVLPVEAWENMREGEALPVRYVPSAPELNQAVGAREEKTTFLRIVIWTIFLGTLSMWLLTRTGYDICREKGRWFLLKPNELPEDHFPPDAPEA